MTRPVARRSIFGPAKAPKHSVVIKFPSGRPKTKEEVEQRKLLAQSALMQRFGYSASDAALVVDDFAGGEKYGVWDETVMALMGVTRGRRLEPKLSD